jgi:hypothetical protein
MRRLVLALAAMMMLTACASSYQSRTRNDCERDNRGVERAMC